MPSNTAAWLTASKANPLEVKSAPYTSPKENQIVIKNGAVAINPADWAIQYLGEDIFPQLYYPCIFGEDVAGEVVEVGSAVSRFKVGDRVVGYAGGFMEKNPPGGGFQQYTVLSPYMVSQIPDTMSFEQAAVIPLGLTTAASGLFEKDQLALQHPSIPPKPTGKALLVWGGSTSVGSNAIQLAVAAGYEVVTTASPKNFNYVTKLGASQVFDYNSVTIVEDLVNALKGKTIAGAMLLTSVVTKDNDDQSKLSRTPSAAHACVEVVAKSEGTKFMAMGSPVPDNLPSGVDSKFIVSTQIQNSEVGRVIYEDFLPKALAAGTFVAAPELEVVGKGLEFIQKGLDIQKKGVSAKKVVISL